MRGANPRPHNNSAPDNAKCKAQGNVDPGSGSGWNLIPTLPNVSCTISKRDYGCWLTGNRLGLALIERKCGELVKIASGERVGKLLEKPIKCNCGKLLARVRDGKVYVWCKVCKKEIQLKTE